jgi:hypothetical protein
LFVRSISLNFFIGSGWLMGFVRGDMVDFSSPRVFFSLWKVNVVGPLLFVG